jgi:hypothetical protein
MPERRAPEVVLLLATALEARLGRPAYIRKVVNQRAWYITDPVFSFVQRGLNTGLHGYRAGFYVDFTSKPHHLDFLLVHSPTLARVFKRNLTVETLCDVAKATARYRTEHVLYRDSRRAQLTLEGREIRADSIRGFLEELRSFEERHGLVRDLFPRTWNRGRTGKAGPHATWAGNTFQLRICDEAEDVCSERAALQLVRQAWPLFRCLYPGKAKEVRTAHVARRLRDGKIPRRCELALLALPQGARLPSRCDGPLEGAHIVPYARGGTDRLDNSLWLCRRHHRATEGRLSGRRSVGIRYRA